jgi:hypothetical protein
MSSLSSELKPQPCRSREPERETFRNNQLKSEFSATSKLSRESCGNNSLKQNSFLSCEFKKESFCSSERAAEEAISERRKDDIWSRFILPDRPQHRLQVAELVQNTPIKEVVEKCRLHSIFPNA